MSSTPDVQEMLRELGRTYRLQLPEKLAQIGSLWDEIRKAKVLDQDKAQALHRLVHSLTGSGATFGMAALSATARELEGSLKELSRQPDMPTAEMERRIAAQWQAVQDSIREQEAAPVQVVTTQGQDPEEKIVRDKKRIILIESDPSQADTIVVQVGYFGYEVHVLQDMVKLEAAMEALSPLAVVVDAELAEGCLAGPLSYSKLPERIRNKQPVIFISSRSDIAARLDSVRAGGVAYFVKPVDIGLMVDKLDVLLAERETEACRVLIVDDSEALASIYAFSLQQAGMETRIVTDPLQLLGPLSEFNPDLILLDMYMPDCSGEDIARVIRQQEAYVGTPIVFLSAETDVEKQLSALKLGADDFLTKPIAAEHLVASVTARVKRSRILRSFMVRDSLTGLYNHTKLKEILDFEMSRAARQKRPLVFAMVDIDNFKRVNDVYGHPVGDRVIKSLSRILKQRLRKTDIVGRYGGEEFAVILTDTDGETAFRVLNEIREGFEQIRQQYEHGEFVVTFSCGLAEFPKYKIAAELGEAADQALYKAKRAGRNRVCR